jgi:plasmid stability protein
MATLTLKNVPEGLVTRLKEVASRNRRSLNQETIFRLETSLGRDRRSSDELVGDLRRTHKKLAAARPLTDAFLRRAKSRS